MPLDLVVLAVGLFAFIISMIGVLGCFFSRRWKWFVLTLICVVLSTTLVAIELYRCFIPPPEHELPPVIRTPLSPL